MANKNSLSGFCHTRKENNFKSVIEEIKIIPSSELKTLSEVIEDSPSRFYF